MKFLSRNKAFSFLPLTNHLICFNPLSQTRTCEKKANFIMKFGTRLKITNVLLPFLPWCDLEKEDSVIDFIQTNFPKLISQIWTIWLANIKTNFAINQSKWFLGNYFFTKLISRWLGICRMMIKMFTSTIFVLYTYVCCWHDWKK